MMDDTTATATGRQGVVLRTINGGLSWGSQNSGVNDDINDLSFLDRQVGWITGQGGNILRTTDGGVNWFRQTSGTSIWIKN